MPQPPDNSNHLIWLFKTPPSIPKEEEDILAILQLSEWLMLHFTSSPSTL
jgi:hypothetical protein